MRRGLTLFAALLLCARAVTGATFTVTNTADSGAGSLRQAILDANASPGADTIAFDIAGSGVQTIAPTATLPDITDPVTIDGYTQPGSSVNTDPVAENAVILIELDGEAEGSGTGIGLTFAPGSDGSTVRGLVVNRCANAILFQSSGNRVEGCFVGTDPTGTASPGLQTAGVRVAGAGATDNTVGGTDPSARNLISGNTIGVDTLYPTGVLIQGNLIGVDATGAVALPNRDGIDIGSPGATIGGAAPGARNVVSGNLTQNVYIGGNTGAVIQGNYIGTDATGSFLIPQAADDVFLNGASGATVGGPAAGAGNVIAGSAGAGIEVINSSGGTIQGNLIGTDQTGTVILGNALVVQFGGIYMNGSSSTTIGGPDPGEGNVIAGSFGNGITVYGFGTEHSVTIRGNAIYSQHPFSSFFHAVLGIDLGDDGPTPNDVGDGDTGWNGKQNYPFVTSAVPAGPSAGTHVTGVLSSAPSTGYDLDFYENASCLAHPHDFYEGQSYLGHTSVVTDGTGLAAFDVVLTPTIAPDSVVTATATDPDGNTSEFSPRTVYSMTPASGPAAGGTAVTLTGTSFLAGATVSIGGQPAASVVVTNDHTITAATPALAPGSVNDVTVENPDQLTGTLAKGWVADFLDVPPGQQFYSYVTTLVQNAITVGVGGGNYGVDQSTLRQQMAVFLMKAKHGLCYTPPPCVTATFTDVPCSSGFAPWIYELVTEGITGGCGDGTTYCPADPVKRQQMAVLLLRTFEGAGYAPPACTTASFDDVPCSSPFATWIYELVARNITGGCGNNNYCPSDPATRGQMATFLTKTFSLQ